MSDWTIAFLFTYKAQAIIDALQRAIRPDLIVITLCVLYLIYVAIAKILRKTYFDRKLLPIILIVLVLGITHLQDTFKRLQYFQSEYAKLDAIYENQEYKITEGSVAVQHTQPAEGHTAGDIIRVGDVTIEYSCFNSTLGYSETIAYGGILTEGTIARIYYYQSGIDNPEQNLILRIDLPNNKSTINENHALFQCTR